MLSPLNSHSRRVAFLRGRSDSSVRRYSLIRVYSVRRRTLGPRYLRWVQLLEPGQRVDVHSGGPDPSFIAGFITPIFAACAHAVVIRLLMIRVRRPLSHPQTWGMLLTANGTLATRATEGTPTTLTKRRTRPSGGYCESSYDAACARQQSVRKEAMAVYELIESIRTAACPAHSQDFDDCVCDDPSRLHVWLAPEAASCHSPHDAFFGCHSQKSMRHNDLDADEPIGD
jgi:hypothetical protein